MSVGEKSLGQGIVGTESTVLYSVPHKFTCHTTQIQFTNIGSTEVVLNVYKRVNNIDYPLSPNDFIFPAHYMAQEDATITMNTNDGIYAVCNTEGAVTYIINGVEQNIIP